MSLVHIGSPATVLRQRQLGWCAWLRSCHCQRHDWGPQRLEGPADLVVEIASEGDPGFDAREKLPRYQEAGIQEIWLIDPMESRVRVETIDQSGRYQSRILSSGRLESTVVPGFWIELDWLWQRLLPSTWGCLQELIGTA